MERIKLWVVSYCDDNTDAADVAVFRDRAVAASYYKYIVNSNHKRVSMSEQPIRRSFEYTDTTPVESLGITKRATLCLKRNGVNTLDELFALTQKEFIDLHGLGLTMRSEILDKVHERGLIMQWEEPNEASHHEERRQNVYHDGAL